MSIYSYIPIPHLSPTLHALHVIMLFSAEDCFELGRIAYNQQDWYHSLKWMQETLNQLNENRENPKNTKTDVDRAAVLDYLAYSTFVVS